MHLLPESLEPLQLSVTARGLPLRQSNFGAQEMLEELSWGLSRATFAWLWEGMS